MKALIVDDIHENRYALSELLASIGVKVLQAGSGLEAINVIEKIVPTSYLLIFVYHK